MNHLPDELLLEIFSSLAVYPEPARRGDTQSKRNTQLRRKGLYSLCLTSRRMHRIAEYLLYRVYVWDDLEHNHDLWLFTRRIIDRPDLAERVEYLRLAPCLHSVWPKPEPDDIDFKKSLEVAREVYQKEDKFSRSWLQALSEGTEDAQVALLVSLCPKVVELDISIPPYRPEHLFTFMLMDMATSGSKVGKLHKFSALQKVFVQANQTGVENSFQPHFVAPILRLPALRSLAVDSASDTPLDVESSWPEQRTCAVEELTFTNSELEVHSIAHFTNACTTLKSFSCEWNGCVGKRARIDLPGLRNVLLPHKSSLESLELDTSGSGWLRTQYAPLRVSPVGSLKEFESLKYIKMCGRTLSGRFQSEPVALPQILPISLEVLVTHDFSYGILSALEHLAYHAREVPKLKLVAVPDLNFGFLHDLFASVGVRVGHCWF